jgi:hypothetical protein
VPLLVLLVLWVWLFAQEGAFNGGPNGKTLGGDMAMFLGAARVLQAGGNPYDPAVLYRSEKSWLAGQHIRKIAKRGVVRVGNPPLLFWLLRPVSAVPFNVAAIGSILALELLALIGLAACLAYAGWSARLIPAVVFVLMPQALLAAFYANIVGVVFAGVSLSLLATRRAPYVSGALLVVAWLKPPVALPIAGLILLFLAVDRLRAFIGFVVATLVLLAGTLIVTGPHALVQWVHALFGYSRDIAGSPSISSLSGLYVRWAPDGVRTALELVSLAIALGVTWVVWNRNRGEGGLPLVSVAWLWMLWFLAVPYAHFFDQILLTAPLLALFGCNGSALVQRGPKWSLYLLFFSLLFISWAPGGVQPLALPLAVVAAVSYVRVHPAPAEQSIAA